MSRLDTWWATVRDSLWLMPAVMTAGAIVLAIVTVQIDENYLGHYDTNLFLTFGGGAEGARGILTAISGGLITVTGVVFSVTIVALQLASTYYTPRVLRNFTSDRANQIVLGVFIATFTYALLVLRSVRSPTDEVAAFVPSLSVTIAIALALVSVGFLIFFIDHLARSIQAEMIIDRVAKDTIALVEDLFPNPVLRPPGEEAHEHVDPDAPVMPDVRPLPRAPNARDGVRAVPRAPEVPDTPPAVVLASASGYLESVDEGAIFGLAADARLVVRMEPYMGDFILAGDPLASVWPAEAVTASTRDHVRAAFVTSPERTPYQDVERGLIELSDIAVKTLSYAINDPTTAGVCVDRLAEVLVAFGMREAPPLNWTGKDGHVRFIARPQDFEHAVQIAYAPIRRYGADDVGILRRLAESLGRIAERVPESRRKPLALELAAVRRTAHRSARDPADRAEVERACDEALAVLGEDARRLAS